MYNYLGDNQQMPNSCDSTTEKGSNNFEKERHLKLAPVTSHEYLQLTALLKEAPRSPGLPRRLHHQWERVTQFSVFNILVAKRSSSHNHGHHL